MPCETCWVGDHFAKHAGDPDRPPEVSMVAVGAAFRAVEYELGRSLES